MSAQPTLPTGPRLHDLPPKWDGYRVEWRGWHVSPPTTLELHGLRSECPHCASTAPEAVNFGVVWAAPVGLIIFPAKRRWRGRAAATTPCSGSPPTAAPIAAPTR